MGKVTGFLIFAGSTVLVTVATLFAIRYVGPLQRLAGVTPAAKQIVS